MNEYIAHLTPELKQHLLEDHLRKVGKLAGYFASKFHQQVWAEQAGRLHDLGKYQPDFQTYIREANPEYASEAHLDNALYLDDQKSAKESKTSKGKKGASPKVEHASAGAFYIEQYSSYNERQKRILNYIITGHHTGLQNFNALENRLHESKKFHLDNINLNDVPADIKHFNNLDDHLETLPASKLALSIRMLFSCLVDADFLDTEAFMNPNQANIRGNYNSLEQLKTKFDDYMKQFEKSSNSDVQNLRRHVLNQCLEKSQQDKGVFSLTVPTGGGKTLSSMAFALNHAIRNGFDRIIYVIPYTSIIEQNAEVFSSIFDDNVIEHHSTVDNDIRTYDQKTKTTEIKEISAQRLATENWDAPIIVTTNIQFLESLYHHKTSRLRKLHNIANSVVIFDEAQLLNPAFLSPILDALKTLHDEYSVSLLFCTATQPRFESSTFKGKTVQSFDDGKIQEIIDNPDELFHQLNRIETHIPEQFDEPQSWEDIANELTELNQSVLCIVNTRKGCKDLWQLMPENTIYLSTYLCPKHRLNIIHEIKDKLSRGEIVKVISTSLVEAGVDLDFPVVYRSFAGLDNIAQAGGRCNREGKLSKGKLVVFNSPEHQKHYEAQQEASKTIFLGDYQTFDPKDYFAPSTFKLYFTEYYRYYENMDHAQLVDQSSTEVKINFEEISNKFKLIPDNQISIFVNYDDEIKAMLETLKNSPKEYHRTLLRKMQPYVVSVYENQLNQLIKDGKIKEIIPNIFALTTDELYNSVFGLDVNFEQDFIQ